MLNWARNHPVWSVIGFVVLVVVLWMIFGRSSGDTSAAGSGVISYTPQDSSSVGVGAQLQAIQYQYQAQMQATQASSDIEQSKTAAALAAAQLAADNEAHTNDLAAQVALAKIKSDTDLTTLTTTLAAATAQAQITAQQQQAQLQASIAQRQIDAQLAATNAQNQFNAQMFQQAQETQKQLIVSNENVAKAQIKASKKGPCFVTTAAVDVLGLGDDCEELTTLRAFRDGWLKSQPDGRVLIAAYYDCAPRVVEVMTAMPDAEMQFRRLWLMYIKPAAAAAKHGDNESAFSLYITMLNEVSKHDAGMVRYLASLGFSHVGLAVQAA